MVFNLVISPFHIAVLTMVISLLCMDIRRGFSNRWLYLMITSRWLSWYDRLFFFLCRCLLVVKTLMHAFHECWKLLFTFRAFFKLLGINILCRNNLFILLFMFLQLFLKFVNVLNTIIISFLIGFTKFNTFNFLFIIPRFLK